MLSYKIIRKGYKIEKKYVHWSIFMNILYHFKFIVLKKYAF